MLSDLKSLFAEVWTLKQNYPRSYRRLFPNVSEWGKVFLGCIASRDTEIVDLLVELEEKSEDR